MSITFIPQKGFTFDLAESGVTRQWVVTRYDEEHRLVFYKSTDGKHTRCQGLDFWNSKTQIAKMATLKELGHK